MILLLLIVSLEFITGNDITVCETEQLDISCLTGKVLVIESALYGRDDEATCVQTGNYRDTLCPMVHVIGILNTHCFRKNACSIQPEELFQPDPACPDIVRYVKATYSCVPEKNIHTLCTSNLITDQEGYLVSQNYPGNYYPNKKCFGEIRTDEGKTTEMTILDLGLKVRWPKTRCFDWLIMYDRSSPTKAKVYCGSIDAIKEPTFLTFNHPVFKFKSNPKGSQRGFLIKFEVKSTKLDEAKVDGINDNEKIQELRNQLALLEEKNEAANRYQQQKQVVIIEDNTLHNKPQNKENSQSNQNKRDVTEIQQPVDKEAIGEYKEQLDNDVQYFSQWNSRKGGAIIGDECVRESIALPEHSYITSYKEGKKLQIGCVQGFTMDDEDKGLFVCHKSKWAGEFALCLAHKCKVPETPNHGEVIYRKLSAGNVVAFICHKGYTLVGEHSVICMTGGQWSGSIPTCIENGMRTLSFPGEILVAVLMTILFLSLRKRISGIIGSMCIRFDNARYAILDKYKEVD